jgi:hypothetical protein
LSQQQFCPSPALRQLSPALLPNTNPVHSGSASHCTLQHCRVRQLFAQGNDKSPAGHDKSVCACALYPTSSQATLVAKRSVIAPAGVNGTSEPAIAQLQKLPSGKLSQRQ